VHDSGAVGEVERFGDLDRTIERLVQLERAPREPRLEGLAVEMTQDRGSGTLDE
jgi:hypothetical protein